jgi:hypothetical protein
VAGKELLLNWDWTRTGRLGAFGLLFYGPLMHHWYRALNTALPVDRAASLAAKLPPFVAKARGCGGGAAVIAAAAAAPHAMRSRQVCHRWH